MKKVGVLLIAAALIAGMVGCGGVIEYNLTISSTTGGNVTTPGEGTFTYDEGTVVNLVAEAEEGYWFVEWTGNVSAIADVNAAATNITMNDDYPIMANFKEIPPVQYDLSINSTEGGSVTEPGEDIFTYDEGTVVDLVAEAEEGYWFVEWTGNVSTIADIYAAATNITMNGDYEIIANFGSVYGDYSDIMNHVITSQGEINLQLGTEVNPSEGEHAPVEYYGGPWPTAAELGEFYWEDVKDEMPYGSGTIDLNGVNMNLGPLYRDGTLTIKNSSNTPATLTLTGTIYITGDTLIGTTGKDMTLDLNGQTIFVASNSSAPQKALELGGKCSIIRPGAIIAIGDIYFQPSIPPGMTDPIFVMSVSGETLLQPGGDFYGAVAGSVEVGLQPGASLNYPEAGFGVINFPGCID